MKHAVLLGGTGSLADTAGLLADSGWRVTVTGRDPVGVPPSWRERDIHFVRLDRRDEEETGALVRGADLIVDATTYAPDRARSLAAWSRDAGATVQISSNAVYADLSGLVDETRATTPWHGEEVDSQLGYAANKSECDRILIADGERVSILRPAKIHGPGCRRAREWSVVKRLLDGRSAILLPDSGATRESTTSTLTLARAILACAEAPADRVVNVADGDPAPVSAMVAAITAAVRSRRPELGPVTLALSPLDSPWRLPWFSDKHLSTNRLRALLGTEPPAYVATVAREVDWLLDLAGGPAHDHTLPPWLDLEFFTDAFPYAAEDRFLSHNGPTTALTC